VYTFEALFPPQVKTHGEGRKCQHEGCSQVLSIYNPHRYCYRHYLHLLMQESIRAEKNVLVVGKRGVPTF
jgi:hypothetical protein